MTERHATSGADSTGIRAERILASVGSQARTVQRNSAEAKRRERAGVRSPGGRGSAAFVWQAPPRNGLSVRLYVYRGTGEDQYAHLYDEEELCG